MRLQQNSDTTDLGNLRKSYLKNYSRFFWLRKHSAIVGQNFFGSFVPTSFLSHPIFNNRPYTPKESSNFEFFNEFEWIYRMNEGVGIKNFMIYISIDIQRLIFDYQNDCKCDN